MSWINAINVIWLYCGDAEFKSRTWNWVNLKTWYTLTSDDQKADPVCENLSATQHGAVFGDTQPDFSTVLKVGVYV